MEVKLYFNSLLLGWDECLSSRESERERQTDRERKKERVGVSSSKERERETDRYLLPSVVRDDYRRTYVSLRLGYKK